MNRLKDSVRDHALNEDLLLRRIHSSLPVTAKEEKFMTFKRILPLGLAAALLLAVMASWSFFVPGVSAPVTTGTAAEKPASSAYAMVAIDINPSFEVYMDDSFKVVSIQATNKDAKQLYQEETARFTALIGQNQAEAVVAIVALAKEKGFLPNDATVETASKYVLVTTAILDADADGEKDTEESLSDEDELKAEAEQDALGQQIQAAVEKALAEDADTIKVAIIKATLREVQFAEKDKLPLGLFIVKGMMTDSNGDGQVDATDVPVKVADLVKNPEVLTKLETRATLIGDSKNYGQAKKEAQVTEASETGETESSQGKPADSPAATAPGQSKKAEAVTAVSE